MSAFVDEAVSRIAREEKISYNEAVEEYLGYFDAAFLCGENIVGLCVEKLQRNREIVEKDYDYCFEAYQKAKKEYKHAPKKLYDWILEKNCDNTIAFAAFEAFEYFKFLEGI